MTNIFNGIQTVPYTAPAQTAPQSSVQVKDAVASSSVSTGDKVDLSSKSKEKKGPVRAVKDFIASFKKFFSTTGEYVKGTAKGLVTGAALGSVVYTAGSIVNKVKNKSGKAHIILAGVAAAGSLAVNLWNASLNASEKASNIEHRYTGHNK